MMNEMKKEEMKIEIEMMTEKEYATFFNDAVRGKYLRDCCVHCDDFKTCEKTANKLDDCRMEIEVDSQQEMQERWGESEKETDEAEAESSAEKNKM